MVDSDWPFLFLTPGILCIQCFADPGHMEEIDEVVGDDQPLGGGLGWEPQQACAPISGAQVETC